MDFTVPANVKSITARVREFITDEVIPLEPAFLNGEFRAMLPILAEKRNQVKAAGLWAPHLPRAYGGMGLSLVEFAHISEELGRSPLGHYLFNCQAPDVGNMEILMEFGDEGQKRTYLEPLARGEIRSCYAMTEPAYPGSDPILMATTAVKDGDDYVINGRKWFATGGDGSAFAIVMAVTNPEVEDRHHTSQPDYRPGRHAGLHPCAQYFGNG